MIATPYGDIALTDVDTVLTAYGQWTTTSAQSDILSQIQVGDMVLLVVYGFAAELVETQIQAPATSGAPTVAAAVRTIPPPQRIRSGASSGAPVASARVRLDLPGQEQVQASAASGTPNASARVRTQYMARVRVAASSGAPAIAAQVRTFHPGIRQVAATVSTGAPTASARVRTLAPAIIQAPASTGAPVVTARVSAIGPNSGRIRAAAVTGVPVATARVTTQVIPAAPSMLALAEAGSTALLIEWVAPNDGGSPLLRYEYMVDTGAWVSTGSTATSVLIDGLTLNTAYSIAVRAVNARGVGPASAALSASTLAAMPPSVPLFVAAAVTGRTTVNLVWRTPMSDGGSTITGYEVAVIDEDGNMGAWEAVTSGLTHRVRGLALGHRYGFQARAVNSAGNGTPTATVYAIPVSSAVPIPTFGQAIPLLDLDRQSMVVRLGGLECRVRVWWQPLDRAWYGTLEVPVNTPVVQGRRLAVDSGLLDNVGGVLPGNVVLRALGEADTLAEPRRDAWGRETHGLIWEAG